MAQRERTPVGRSAGKRAGILDAARAAFLERGFAGTTMDEVAAAAAVSKQTIYQHFGDKERLFTAVVEQAIADAEAGTADEVAALGASEDVATDLRAFARRHLADVLQPALIRMRRLVISEADRFPALARTWWERAPQRGHESLATEFSMLASRGVLHLDDPLRAAELFNWLVLSIPLNRAMFGLRTPSRAELDGIADEAVRIFLAAYAA